MKRILLLGAMAVTTTFYAQSNTVKLEKEISDIKTAVSNLQADVQSVKSEYIYLKQVLDINKPILEKVDNNTLFKITKVSGYRKDKTISITLLVESKDENKVIGLTEASIIDIEGNTYNLSSVGFPDLALNIPMKQTVKFYEIGSEARIIKLFRFKMYGDNHKPNTTKIEFKDLNVIWE